MNMKLAMFLIALAVLPAAPLFAASGETAGGKTEEPAVAAAPLYCLRGGLDNCRIVFDGKKQGRVAYLGGSITASAGWRDLTYDLLKKRFPETTFDFINAGVGGTNSTYGSFRLEEDVFKNGLVDLLFLEFAVNDDGEPAPDNRCVRAMEGIIRHARQLNPKIDILILYFADAGKVESYRKREVPKVIQEHETVAEHYGIPVIYLAQEVTRRIGAGEFEWSQFSRDTCHPLERGHALYAECIDVMLRTVWSTNPPPNAEPRAYDMPLPLDPMNYERGRFIPIQQARVVEGWTRVPQWETEKKCNYGGAVDVLAAETSGAMMELEFEGTLIGISAIAGMDAGVLDVVIDGGAPRKADLFDNYCLQFHRPVCHVLAENLPTGKHVLRLSMSPESNPQSKGHAARILEFVAN
jgi:sialidase-1